VVYEAASALNKFNKFNKFQKGNIMRANEQVRFHMNSNGTEVMFSGKWVPADEKVMENIYKMMLNMFHFRQS